MVRIWEPGTTYAFGDIVEYQGEVYAGATYKIIQPHTSQGDWTPPATPALWGRIPNLPYGSSGRREQHHEEAPGYGEKPPAQPQAPTQLPPQKQKKHWWDLDDKHKKPFEVGGGLAAGSALVAAGVAAYRHHEKKKDEKKVVAWGAQEWIDDAQRRTEDFYRNRPRDFTTWVLVHGKQIPPNAIVAGRLDGQPVFIIRAYFEGGIQLGHASQSNPTGGQIGYAHNVIDVDTYEILLGDSNAVTWIDARGRFKPYDYNHKFVEGGKEGDGTPLFIALVRHDGVDIPGKAGEKLNGALIAYNGTEIRGKEYKVLAYA